MPSASFRGRKNRWTEENTLTILDASGEKDSKHTIDDSAAFLEAVRGSSIIPEDGICPTSKIYEAIFRILKDGKSLELIMASYYLLNELEKCFPRVYVSNVENYNSLSDIEVVVVKESWLPFSFGIDGSSGRETINRDIGGRIDSSGFNHLIQELSEVVDGDKLYAFESKVFLQFLTNMLLFQYLINVLERDFLPRHLAYDETKKWPFLRDSVLNTLLGSRRINYKSFLKDCLSIVCCVHGKFIQDLIHLDDFPEKPCVNLNKSVEFALLQSGSFTSHAVQRLMIMIMELDISKQKADVDGYTTRADGVRTPLLEMILDEITYNKDILSPFLQALKEPKLKMEIVLQYFSKYVTMSSIGTRRSTHLTRDATLDGFLISLSNINTAKTIVKKMGSTVTQLLLAHAFQAYLSLLSPSCSKSSALEEYVGDSSSLEICRNLISAFDCLKKSNGELEILALGKEALLIASTIISTKS